MLASETVTKNKAIRTDLVRADESLAARGFPQVLHAVQKAAEKLGLRFRLRINNQPRI